MSSLAQETQPRSSAPASGRSTSIPTLLRSQFQLDRVPVRNPVNVGLMAEQAAARFGRVPIYLDQPFTWDPEQRLELDFVECATLIEQFSAVFKQAGVQRWDRVVILKSPNYDIQSIAWAAARIGAIPALISARLDPDIINILLDRLQARFIVTDPQVAEYARLDKDRLRALNITAIAPIDGGIPVQDLWGGAVPPARPLKDDEPMMITHTSSTTGVSKLAETTAKATGFSTFIEAVFPFGHGKNELFASVISHVHVRAAVAQAAAMSRGTPLLGVANSADETILSLFSRYRPTIMEAHPNAYVGWEQLVDDPAQPFSTIRLFFNTFDAIHPRTIRRLLEASKRSYPVWLQSYGMTETQPVTARIYTRRSAKRLSASSSRSVGWTLPLVRARIADPATGERQSSRKPGMIQARTPARALSFVGTPEKFSDRRHGKWFDTGDWGRRNRFGQLEVLDRVADRIEGVDSCLWIEDVLLDRIPDAEEIVVVPDEKGKPVAVVCMRDGKPLTADAWKIASDGVSGLGDPFEVSPEQLQRTATVKARRFLLTEMIKNGEGGDATVRPEVALRDGA